MTSIAANGIDTVLAVARITSIAFVDVNTVALVVFLVPNAAFTGETAYCIGTDFPVSETFILSRFTFVNIDTGIIECIPPPAFVTFTPETL